MSRENPAWVEDQIALELKLKLGVEHATSTIRKYMIDGGVPRKSTWRTFLSSHASQIFAMDFTTHYLWDYTVLYILVIIELERRRVVHVAVTSSPTLPWVKKQIREATPWGESPRFLLHDNDGIYGQRGRRKDAEDSRGRKRYRCTLDHWLGEVMNIEGIPTPYGAPNAAAHIERFMGTLRRECLQNFIFVSEGHLRRTSHGGFVRPLLQRVANASGQFWDSVRARQRASRAVSDSRQRQWSARERVRPWWVDARLPSRRVAAARASRLSEVVVRASRDVGALSRAHAARLTRERAAMWLCFHA